MASAQVIILLARHHNRKCNPNFGQNVWSLGGNIVSTQVSGGAA